jgi:hypothetical protein
MTYFLYIASCDQRKCCHQSPLAPVIVNLDMEQQAISLVANKPAYGYRYINNRFVAWTYRKEQLQSFLQHLNSIHSNIQSPMEM